MAPIWFEIACGACSWREELSPTAMSVRLRGLGMLRRDASPDAELVRELVAGVAEQMVCPECRQPGVRVGRIDLSEEDWRDAVLCEVCRQAIPPERLEVLPDARRCITCQQDAESGRLAAEPEYCPRCGSLMVLRVASAAGITRYRMFCTGDPRCRA